MSNVAITLRRDEPTRISIVNPAKAEFVDVRCVQQRGTHEEDCAVVCFAPPHTPYKFRSSKKVMQHASIGLAAMKNARLGGARRLHSLAHLHNIQYKDC